MLQPSMMIDWARCLLAYETVVGTIPEQPHAATFLVYEKLRAQLCIPMGGDGFRAFASRALSQAKLEAPGLRGLQIAVDGTLHGLDEVELAQGSDIGVVFIAQLLGLFLTFLGQETMRRLVHEVFPFLEITKVSEIPSHAGALIPFEKIQEEVGNLQSISERLEAMADKHPAIEGGLMTIAGNVRNLSSILDVLAVIRNRSGGFGVGVPND